MSEEVVSGNISADAVRVGSYTSRNGMIGAIVGDIAGSRFEWRNRKSKEFTLLKGNACCFTDDTVMTLAVADAILKWKKSGGGSYEALSDETVRSLQAFGRLYPHAGYGGTFRRWIYEDNPQPYNSWGNGAAMRVSACGWIGNSLDEVKSLSLQVTDITHNHPEGIKSAEATAVSIWLARQGWKIPKIRAHVVENYYPIDFTLDEIRPTYHMDESCQGSVPQALEAFFESTSFEDAIRNAVSIGGDSDTIAAIAGSVAEAYWGVPKELAAKAETYLEPEMAEVLKKFQLRHYGNILD